MARYALITFPGGGNLPPLLGLGSELASRGHTVEVLAGADVEPAARATGLSFTALDEQAFWTWTAPRSVPTALRQAVRLHADRPMERRVLAELDRLRPDVVLVDCLLSGCGRAAREAGYRTVVLFHTYLEYWTKSLARGPVGALAALRGRGPLRSWAAADLRLVLCDRTLDPSAEPRPGLGRTEWTGSTEHGVPAAPGEPPLVVVSLSTSQLPGQADAYRRIVRVLGTLPVRAVVTLGGLEVDGLAPAPNVEVRGRAPHEELFPHAALVIAHGGLSTTFRALAHGVPLLLLPMHPLLDQPLVARSVAAAGAGTVLPRTASEERIAAAVRQLLDTPSYAAAAAGLGTRLRAEDGIANAAALLERTCQTVGP